MPRPLSSDEKRVILAMLGPDVEGVEALRGQVDSGFALRHWIDGLPSIDIIVGESCPTSSFPAASSPLTRHVQNGEGDPIGTLHLWIEAGRLSALEYAWLTDDPPVTLPSNDQIQH